MFTAILLFGLLGLLTLASLINCARAEVVKMLLGGFGFVALIAGIVGYRGGLLSVPAWVFWVCCVCAMLLGFGFSFIADADVREGN